MASKTTEHIRKVAAGALFIGAVNDEWRMFSDDPKDYHIGLPIGYGASSIVYVARWVPKDGSPALPCAVKVVDLDKLPPSSLRLLRRETQLMSLSKHPNVLRVRGSWVDGHHLYIALRLMNAGSAADVMRYGWPGGMEEDVVKSVLKQALEGLNYLHINGFIHRDVKAANLLIDDDGTVLLGDLGVAASLCDEEPVPMPSGSGTKMNFEGVASARHSSDHATHAPRPMKKLGKRKSFVGTPCWMAPELISGKQYDAKADIWSFGITAIELTQGRAPRSRESPAKVLLKTVQDEPPSFSREGGAYKYSKAFKDIIDSCLVKDPALRPSAADLLDSSFFKSSKKKSYLVGAILKDLPPLTSRQERLAQRSNSLNRASTSSFASWDFSLHPATPTSTTAKGHSSFMPVSSHSTHHSYHPSIKVPSPIEYDEAEDSVPILEARASGLEALQSALLKEATSNSESTSAFGSATGSGLTSSQGFNLSSSSPDSSVIDDDEDEGSVSSRPTSPEMQACSLPSSSVATTPLSCSPSANVVLREPPAFVSAPQQPSGAAGPGPAANTRSDAEVYARLVRADNAKARAPPALPPTSFSPAAAVRMTSSRSRTSRPGSSPTQRRPDVVNASLAPLKRTTSVGANAHSMLGNSTSGPPGPIKSQVMQRCVTVPEKEKEKDGERKESRWKKLIKGAGSKIVDVATSSKSGELGGTLRSRRNG